MSEPSPGSYERLSGRVTLWLAHAASIGLAAMMFLTLGDVVGRFFSVPLVGTVEVTELIMGMMIYLAIGHTTFRRGHIRVDILIMRLPPKIRAFLDLVTLAIGTAFTGLICWRLFLQAASRVDNNDITQIWEIPVWPVAFVMAIASILLVSSLAFQLWLAARATFGGDGAAYVRETTPGPGG